MFDISLFRKEYVSHLIQNNDYVHLDWIRNCGKTKACIYAAAMYANNNPETSVLIYSIDQKSTKSIIEVNKFLFKKLIFKSNLKRAILNNKSIIYFDLNSIDFVKIDLILLDESFYLNYSHRIFDYIRNNKVKILSNSTSESIKNNDYATILNNYDFLIDKYKTDEELIHFIRMKKIQKIKNNI